MFDFPAGALTVPLACFTFRNPPKPHGFGGIRL